MESIALESGAPRLALGVEYDGSAFRGWQTQQAGVRSVQACVETALSRVANQALQVVCAGRTDAGVHGLAQVVHCETAVQRSERAWVMGTNTYLPDDVRIVWARYVAADFHARFSAYGRAYRYLIFNHPLHRSALWRQRAHWHYHPLDEQRMQQAAHSLLGEHDFSAFRAAECQSRTPMRELRRLQVTRNGEWLCIEAEANAFLHHMVRNLVGVLLAIGEGRREPEWARRVLESRDRRQAGVTAPADGLYLTRVDYPASYAIPQVILPSWLAW